ncbi:MAG: hypothetical protein HKN18_06705 [Silicimonas sp.]|nr:hypothetical protein [Silicimonas sp.]
MTVLTVEQLLSGSTLGLTSGLSDLLVLEIGGRKVLYALSRTENALIELDVAADGTLSMAGSSLLTGTFAVGVSPGLAAITTGGASRLAVAGLPEASGQSLSLGPTGALGTQSALTGIGTLVAPVGLDLGGVAAVVSGRAGTGGIDLFVDQGGLTWSAGLNDAADRYLADVSASTTFDIAGADYLATTSATEDGVNIASASIGSLTQSGALGVPDGLPVNTPSDLAVVQRLGETLLVMASSGSSSVSVVRVETGGTPILADHVLDADWTRIQGASSLGAATYGDFAFVVVGGTEGGLSLFTLLPGGRLVHLDSLADDGTTSLYRVSAVELSISATSLQVFATSEWEAGLTRLEVDLSGLGQVVQTDGTGASGTGTSGDDQVIGSAVAEALDGGAGADILLDGAGVDTLTGGDGADLFVMAADGVVDEITDFERGQDRLDLSAFDFLYDLSQLQVTPTSDGAILTHGNETILLYTADNAPLLASELTNADILNVDRPPLLAVGQTLFGGTGPDTLNGGAGPDTIVGAAGDDALSGSYGDDSLSGGAGFDALNGDGGNDTLRGQSEDDTLIGGLGDDLLFGDNGNDVIYGDDIA